MTDVPASHSSAATASPGWPRWSLAQAEEYLRSLELFGMRFGLDRMRRLMTALGLPQRRFDSIHVVGSNGKSSTSRMIAALLHHQGLRSGAYLSPHLVSYTERVRVDERDIEEGAFASAVGRAAWAAGLVDRTLGPDDGVTQFEVLTAAAFAELARRQVDVTVVEAGLGGRYDATNVLASTVQVLTNVSLEHTRWLGPSITDIAREKLAVVPPGGLLVLGHGLDPEAEAVADEVRATQRATVVRAPVEAAESPPPAAGSFQRGNFALACAAADAYLRARDPESGGLSARAMRAAATTPVPGRFQVVDHDPPTVLDAAHNPDGVRALLDALDQTDPGSLAPIEPGPEGAPAPESGAAPSFIAVLSILEDKDAAAMLALLLPRCLEVVFTTSGNQRALSPATLASLARQLDGPPAHIEPDPARALRLARERARALAPQGARAREGALPRDRPLAHPSPGEPAGHHRPGRPHAVVVTGSIFLIGELVRAGMARDSEGGRSRG